MNVKPINLWLHQSWRCLIRFNRKSSNKEHSLFPHHFFHLQFAISEICSTNVLPLKKQLFWMIISWMWLEDAFMHLLFILLSILELSPYLCVIKLSNSSGHRRVLSVMIKSMNGLLLIKIDVGEWMLGRLLCIVKLTDGDYNVNVSIIGIMLYEEEFSCGRETESIKILIF